MIFPWPETHAPDLLLREGEGEGWDDLVPAQPSEASVAGQAVAAELFRAGMRRVAAAVSIVTTDGAAGRCGFTASAVCSVTDAPPTLLVCMNRRSVINPVFKANGAFCVSTLAAEQESLSRCFAGLDGVSMDERFRRAAWTTLATGAPALEGALVAFDCRLTEVKEVGTHSVLFGLIEAIDLARPERDALLYVNRGYRRVALAG